MFIFFFVLCVFWFVLKKYIFVIWALGKGRVGSEVEKSFVCVVLVIEEDGLYFVFLLFGYCKYLEFFLDF